MRIEKIVVKAIFDEGADFSFIGEYTNKESDGCICRLCGEFVEDHKESCEKHDCREYRYFLPYAGGEKSGSKYYREYGQQDYSRMEGLNSGDWHFIGIEAEASVSYVENGHWRFETLTSGGLYGIESDSGDYLLEVQKEQLADLRQHLAKFGINAQDQDWQELTNIELTWD